jgi:ethanolamine ammonia-lyase large subunit
MNPLLSLFAQANAFKEGDLLVGGTQDELIREIARGRISDLSIAQIANTDFVEDRLTEILAKSLNRKALKEISHLRISELKAILLSEKGPDWVKIYATGLPSEAIAAVVKVMSDSELSQVARSIFNPMPSTLGDFGVAIGSPMHFGSRIQPNSPGDEEDEILLSTLEGLCYGCGDVILGLNPASDDLETIVRTEKLLQNIVERLQLPTRFCVLSDMVKQKSAMAHTKVDVGFQSLAGTSKGLEGMLGCDVDELLDLCRYFQGLYFETGQGSEVTNGAAQGVDMLTLEARCYGLARYIKQETGKWMIVNDVAGFIGPEVFSTGAQLHRACLEDTVMAKLHGLVMGLDVCSTFHMGIHPAELQQLTTEIVQLAAPAYLMAVAGKADPMLGYLTTSYREHPRLRKSSGKGVATAMQKRLVEIGALTADGSSDPTADRIAKLYVRYQQAGGDKRNSDDLELEAKRKIKNLQEKGCDLGYGVGHQHGDPDFVTKRLDGLFDHARKALFAQIDPAVIRDCCGSPVQVNTESTDRDDYLAHPASGEKINQASTRELIKLAKESAFTANIQFVISDGLNANALSEHLRKVLPALKKALYPTDLTYNPHDIIVRNGRVRAGYHIGQILQPDLIVHLIGERPGTGLNQLSAYITYGKSPEGFSIFDPDMDHSLTTAVCGIHPQGKSPASAVEEIIRILTKAVKARGTGVKLGK